MLKEILKDNNFYRKLEQKAARLANGMMANCAEACVPCVLNRVGSMMTAFFTDADKVFDYTTVKTSDTKRYAKFFHACLERGMYVAPSQFEAIFVSMAHSNKDIDHALTIHKKAVGDACMIESLDRKILDILQFNFPLTSYPFKFIALRVGSTEEKVIARIKKLKDDKIIRQISAIFDSNKIGYKSTLVAFRVEPQRTGSVAAVLNEHAGISHNYLRDNKYNIWFTLTLPSNKDLKNEIAKIARSLKISDWLFLPSIKTFKIQYQLHMEKISRLASKNNNEIKKQKLPKLDKAFVRELQKDLPLVSRSFSGYAKKLKTTEKEILKKVTQYTSSGLIKRFAAVLRQKKAGFPINIMVAWNSQNQEKDKLGIIAARQQLVSHCYERPVRPGWPYSLYTMIHAKTEKEAENIISKISKESGVNNFITLPTIKEYKKVRVKYF